MSRARLAANIWLLASVVLLIVGLVVLVTTSNRDLILFEVVVGMPVLGWSCYDLAKSRSLRERQEREQRSRGA